MGRGNIVLLRQPMGNICKIESEQNPGRCHRESQRRRPSLLVLGTHQYHLIPLSPSQSVHPRPPIPPAIITLGAADTDGGCSVFQGPSTGEVPAASLPRHRHNRLGRSRVSIWWPSQPPRPFLLLPRRAPCSPSHTCDVLDARPRSSRRVSNRTYVLWSP